jgi:hypothetical protein
MYSFSLTQFRSKTTRLWRFYIARSFKTCVGVYVKCSEFLSDFNKICIFSTDFHESPAFLSDFNKLCIFSTDFHECPAFLSDFNKICIFSTDFHESPAFLSDFNKICIFSTDFHESPQCQISRIGVQWESRR